MNTDGKTWSVNVPGAVLAANGDISASVTTRDTAGNATTANTSHTYGVDTVAPVVSISIDNVTSDNLLPQIGGWRQCRRPASRIVRILHQIRYCAVCYGDITEVKTNDRFCEDETYCAITVYDNGDRRRGGIGGIRCRRQQRR
ncbi:hypothetical protein [Pectobacterium brasiliense]|uniref:hypothetical protein n=1 Tax=Pectobacterium brasiliense TaxID=180957 RepID=UPI001F07C851|nr:hypothetical protein [Pectobacterium brasiliense]